MALGKKYDQDKQLYSQLSQTEIQSIAFRRYRQHLGRNIFTGNKDEVQLMKLELGMVCLNGCF